MADEHVAWTVFHTERNEYGQPTKTIQPGESVSASDLDVSDEEFESLVESGAVSTIPYPEDLPDNVSPKEYFDQQDAALASGELSEEEAKAVMERQVAMNPVDADIEATNAGETVEPESEPEPAKPAPKTPEPLTPASTN